MMSLAASLTLFAFIAVGGAAHQYRAVWSDAVIYYQDGHREEVRVKNRADYFCPAYCRVAHQHLVHDIRWSCADRVGCSHFTVLHVITHGNAPIVSNRLPAKGGGDPQTGSWTASRTP